MLIKGKFAALVGIAAIVLTACSSTAVGTKPSAAAGASGATAAGCKVGVSWNNYTEERWAKWDEPAIKAALAAAGAEYLSNDAKSSAATQATNIDQLISQGAKVLIVLAQDGTAIKTSVTSASSQAIPVIGYDRLIEDPKALYTGLGVRPLQDVARGLDAAGEVPALLAGLDAACLGQEDPQNKSRLVKDLLPRSLLCHRDGRGRNK